MNNSLDFSGKVALVTGAAAGMGLATAGAFAQAGAAVVLAHVDKDSDVVAGDEKAYANLAKNVPIGRAGSLRKSLRSSCGFAVRERAMWFATPSPSMEG